MVRGDGARDTRAPGAFLANPLALVARGLLLVAMLVRILGRHCLLVPASFAALPEVLLLLLCLSSCTNQYHMVHLRLLPLIQWSRGRSSGIRAW